MSDELGNKSSVLRSFATSIYVLGLAFGPLVLSPLSEIYGRLPVLNFANLWLAVWQIPCARAGSIGSLIAFRFLAGVGGAASLTLGGGLISDMFLLEQRGTANSIFSVGPLFGPVLGPILGGFISERAGWRWVYWVLLAACITLAVIVFGFSRETNHVVLLRRRTEKLRKVLGRDDLVSIYDVSTPRTSRRELAILAAGVIKPFQFITRSPIVPLLAIYMAFVFGLLYLLLTTVAGVFTDTYDWPLEICGLAYLGLGLGFVMGLVITAWTSDATVIRLTKANRGGYKPEMRLAPSIIFALFVPISFFWYGWATDQQVHWTVPILGLAPFGFGMMGIFASIQTYFIDISGHYSASILAALTTVRCIFGCFLPLAGPQMYASLGLGWGNSLLGFIGLLLIPAPLAIYRFGGGLREKYPLML
ncbi:MFS transporter prlG [Colletotrichum siamense]|uniref:MFS transporter prlG n=1 Tax=Colletotrichum siamense TaxID=690259 RepID=UPI0018723D83|nr:MFS transporter prlG [Colletotrichum siamense]KAF5487525.1 MFS transporter prlG [Colletotrichum siamense]